MNSLDFAKFAKVSLAKVLCCMVHITRYGTFKIMILPYILYCGGQGLPTTIQNVWENHDYKNAISCDMYVYAICLKF